MRATRLSCARLWACTRGAAHTLRPAHHSQRPHTPVPTHPHRRRRTHTHTHTQPGARGRLRAARPACGRRQQQIQRRTSPTQVPTSSSSSSSSLWCAAQAAAALLMPSTLTIRTAVRCGCLWGHPHRISTANVCPTPRPPGLLHAAPGHTHDVVCLAHARAAGVHRSSHVHAAAAALLLHHTHTHTHTHTCRAQIVAWGPAQRLPTAP
jgi:hypothetical protein